MAHITAAFIGLGLIGGSIAKGLKRRDPSIRIMAYMRTRQTLEKAKQDGIVDVILDGVGEALRGCDIVFLCTPVEYNAAYMSQILPFLKEGAILTDVGSTKSDIHEAAARLGLEPFFIGGHPMAGSEKTGYENATDHLLENAYYILTPTPKTPAGAVETMTRIARGIGAIPLVLDYRKHDLAVAAISHLPHLIAASLVNLVHDSDDPDQLMKRLAAGGFKDITRIASSSPVMWEQICLSNEANISFMLERYIDSLKAVHRQLQSREPGAIRRLFEESGSYRNSFADSSKGAIEPVFSFSVDVVDEPGAITIISSILSSRGINIKNIGINHNREGGEGALRISFYDEESLKAAWKRLKKYNYSLFAG